MSGRVCGYWFYIKETQDAGFEFARNLVDGKYICSLRHYSVFCDVYFEYSRGRWGNNHQPVG